MLRIVLVRPGETDFDEQRRIKGTLDVPLNGNGTHQVAQTAFELTSLPIETVYTSPCTPAQQTAEVIARSTGAKIKRLDRLANVDQGLWQGKRIEEVKQTQPKVYRQWQEAPETVCPPQGESLVEAGQRVRTALQKIKKNKSGVVAIVAPEPIASVVRRQLSDLEFGDLWKAECEHAQWEMFEVNGKKDPAKKINGHTVHESEPPVGAKGNGHSSGYGNGFESNGNGHARNDPAATAAEQAPPQISGKHG